MHNTNKIFLFCFLGIVVITIVLVSFYLFAQYGGPKSSKPNMVQTTVNQNTVSQNDVTFPKSAPFVYTISLQPATVGKQYKTVIQAGVSDLNVQISGRVESGLPPGLQLTSCQTEYDSPTIAKIAAKNSFGKCTIEGIPQQSGNFTVRVYFSIQEAAGDFFKDLPLVVNP
jgi:hypothetical protein